MRDTIKEFAEKMDCYVEKNFEHHVWETMPLHVIWDDIADDMGRLNKAFGQYHRVSLFSDGHELSERAIEIATDAMMLWSQLQDSTRHNRNGRPVKRLPKVTE